MTATEILIDQTLHGYSGGHRLLMGSVKLLDAEARTMLVLSDAAAGSSNSNHGYLTGYPLPGVSKYVLARTWPAPEMSRPGCVWTHSLLIDFADLAVISGAGELVALFKRPAQLIADYDRQIPLTRNPGPPATTSHPNAGALLCALYLQPNSKVEMRAGNPEADEELILAVWLQQWPRLRRSFSFCSSVGSDRSTDLRQFDLQVAMAAPGTKRTLIPGAELVEDRKLDPRLSGALEDLHRPNDLRPFLRKVGGDVPRGRSAMIALCQLHDALNGSDGRDTSYSAALEAFDMLGAGQARAARSMVLQHAIKDIDKVDDRTFHFICDNILKDDIDLDSDSARRVGRALWYRSPVNFVEALSNVGSIGHVASVSVQSLDIRQLAEGVAKYPEIAMKLARARPDILAIPRFWESSLLNTNELLESVDQQTETAIIRAIAFAGRDDTVDEVVWRCGSARTLAALGTLDESTSLPDLSRWLNRIARDPNPLGQPLSSGTLSRGVVAELARRLDPDIVPNDFGHDPWLIAAQAPGTLSSLEENRFSAFIMGRALGRRSRSCAELLQISFDRVHQSLADDSMPYDGWQIVERRLNWSVFWDEWDRCRRVRKAVVAKFIDLELDPALFGHLTRSEAVFSELVEIASETRRGRRYLEKVRRAIRDESENFMQARAKLLSKLI